MNKVLLIYTGGTIGMGHNPLTGALEPLDFNHLVESMPEFRQIKTQIDVYQFTPPIDSSDISPERWANLVRIISRNYNNYDGFVILHGTDTMAYTASALSFMLGNLTKPVILTGSQLPIGQLRTDGKENLVTSIELAAMKTRKATPSFRRSVFISVADCFAETAPRRLTPTDSMLSSRSTIHTCAMRASTSRSTPTTSLHPTSASPSLPTWPWTTTWLC